MGYAIGKTLCYGLKSLIIIFCHKLTEVDNYECDQNITIKNSHKIHNLL